MPIFTNNIQGHQVVNVPATISSTMHVTSVTTAGEILSYHYLQDLLNNHLSEILYQEDEDLLPDGN